MRTPEQQLNEDARKIFELLHGHRVDGVKRSAKATFDAIVDGQALYFSTRITNQIYCRFARVKNYVDGPVVGLQIQHERTASKSVQGRSWIDFVDDDEMPALALIIDWNAPDEGVDQSLLTRD